MRKRAERNRNRMVTGSRKVWRIGSPHILISTGVCHPSSFVSRWIILHFQWTRLALALPGPHLPLPASFSLWILIKTPSAARGGNGEGGGWEVTQRVMWHYCWKAISIWTIHGGVDCFHRNNWAFKLILQLFQTAAILKWVAIPKNFQDKIAQFD